MGNLTSRSWAEWAQHRERHLNSTITADRFDFLGLPVEIQTMIGGWLCPNCAFGIGEIPSTDEARALQRALGNLARCSSHLRDVADDHRFHSFVNTPDPAIRDRPSWPEEPRATDIALAHSFNNRAFIELLAALLNSAQLRKNLRFLSLQSFTLRFKEGVSKATLRLLIDGSRSLNHPVPGFVPALLGLPDHTTDDPPSPNVRSYWLDGELWLAGIRPGLRSMDFDIWLVRLLIFKLAHGVERLMMDSELASETFDLDPPAAVLSSVSTLGIAGAPNGEIVRTSLNSTVRFDMETLLSSFPNLWAFQNNERFLSFHQTPNLPDNSPPLGPNLRRLVLSSDQPTQLEYVTRMLREFPNLEWFYFHRKPTGLGQWQPDDEFSNANVFDAVHHCLQVLTYTSTVVTPYLDDGPGGRPLIEMVSYAEPNFSDVPQFRDFRVLERLTVDQALLGRMATLQDYADCPIGPHFPDLDWKLPESLRTLTIRYVQDWPRLAGQLVPLAVAKRAGGQFPSLTDIFVVIADSTTVNYTGTWPRAEIALRPSYKPIVVETGILLREAGIKLSVSTEEIGPRPAGLDEDAVGSGTLFQILCLEFEFF